jgi:protein-disulfide isomerase
MIDKSLGEGITSGVKGTPTFFINGVRHNGSWDLETLLAAIKKKGL